jgi:hypothetical protein
MAGCAITDEIGTAPANAFTEPNEFLLFFQHIRDIQRVGVLTDSFLSQGFDGLNY